MNYINIEEWVKKNQSDSIINISESKEIERWKYPTTIDPVGPLFDEAYKDPPFSKKLFCATLHNVNVFKGRVFDANMKNEILDFSNCYINSNPSKGRLVVDTAIHLTDKWGGENYWHWISMCLAKLSLINEILPNVIYLVNSMDQRFIKQSLISMGINPSNCIGTDNQRSIFCRKLIAPSRIGDRDKMGIMFLRRTLRNYFVPPTKKLFVSRSNRRVVSNENQVMKVLEPFGFERIQCEKMSFDNQINIFSGAKTIIAPHGAGLANLIFVPNNAKVLELRSPKYFGSCYWKLSNHLKLSYYSLIGEGPFPKAVNELSRELNANIKIDLEKLKLSLDLMGDI